MTPEAQRLRDRYERLKADYTVLKRQRQKFQQEADRLFDLQKAADEESAKRQDALDEYGLSPAIKKARKEALKRADAKFRAAYKEFSRAIYRRDKADEQMQWAADDLLEARMRLEDLGYKVNPMAAKKAKKKPSAKQLAARRRFAAAAKARSKAAKKRNGKTIVKAKRVTIVQMPKKMNPVSPSAILRQVPAEKREAVKAAIEQAKTGRLAGLKAADGILESVGYAHNSKISRLVWAIGNQASLKQSRTVNPRKRNATIIKAKRIEHLDVSKIHSLGKTGNPKRRRNVTSASDLVHVGEAKAATRDGVKGWMVARKFFPRSATPKTARLTSGAMLDLKYGDVWKTKRKGNPKKKATKRRKNIAGFMQDGVFHPIRSGVEQRTTKSGTRRVKSKKAYKPSKVGEKFTYSPKKAAKRATQSKRMKAETKQRKATTTRLATRSLQRSVPLKGNRRNPNDAAKAGYESFQGKASTKSTALNFPNGTPANVYKLGTLHSIKLQNGSVIKPSGKTVWLCADTKGKLHLGTTGERLVNAPKGSLGKVAEVEYITSKPHLGEPTVSRYFHKLGEETGEKPTLYSDGNGGLIFKGGAYSITSRGIVN